MKPDLFPLKELLLLFRNELAEIICINQDYPHTLDPHDPIPPWQKREAYSWIFFEINYGLFWGLSDQTIKEKWLTQYPNSLLKAAKTYYQKWVKSKIDLKESYKYIKYGIPPPDPLESLIQYILRLRNLVSKDTYSKKRWRESLGSFLEYVKANIPPNCHGFIDVIFPEDRAFFNNTVIRKVTKDKYPTNIIYVSEILKNLSEEIIWGDPRTQHTSAETFALALLCLNSAKLKVPTQEQLLYEFDGASLSIEEKPNRFFPKCHLAKIPSLFGSIPTEISKYYFDYLSILQKINQKIGAKNRFFKSELDSLTRVLRRQVKKLSLPKKHGKITFITLTSWPNEDPYYRTQIDNSRYK